MGKPTNREMLATLPEDRRKKILAGAAQMNAQRAIAKAPPQSTVSASFDALVTVDPEVLGGTPVFSGTRIPVAILFENLADGLALDEVIDSYPGIRKDVAIEVLRLAGMTLVASYARQR